MEIFLILNDGNVAYAPYQIYKQSKTSKTFVRILFLFVVMATETRVGVLDVFASLSNDHVTFKSFVRLKKIDKFLQVWYFCDVYTTHT